MERHSLFSPGSIPLCLAAIALGACGSREGAGASQGTSQWALSAQCAAPAAIAALTVNLWPPNHKFHEIAVGDCVSAIDACGGELQGEFTWASSDEPIDDIGDGHFGPDVGLGRDSSHACVRSERQGPKDGRVYKLGVRLTDANGQTAESECLVIVDHDQRGVKGHDSGEAYRIQFDAMHTGLQCGAGTPGGGGSGGHGGHGGTGRGGTTGGSGGMIGGSGGTGTTEGTGGANQGGGAGDHVI